MEPIKSRSDLNILRAYDVLYDTLEAVVHAPKLNIMDYESSTALKWFLRKSKTVVQLESPHIHRLNSSKRAICTFKNSFVAVLALVDTNFPIYLWCCIVNQAEITLNLLQT